MSLSTTTTIDRFGIQMLKPTKQGGETWTMNNADFNNDSQVYTFSTTQEYALSSDQDDAGVRWTLSTIDPFYTLISSSRGFDNSSCTTDQFLMSERGYMQTPSDWKNVEFTGNFKVYELEKSTEDSTIRIGFRGGQHQGTASPVGCTGCNYAVEIPMTSGGMIYIRKESWHASFYDWLSTRVSGFDATLHPCGFTIKILCHNTLDGNGVTMEVWLDRDNENEYELVLSGTDYGQINKDAAVCGCANSGQPLIWGSPTVLIQQQGGGNDTLLSKGTKMGWKNLSIREIDPFGTGSTGGTPGALNNRLVIDPPPVANLYHYKNGDLWSSAKIFFIFWGSDWNSRTQPYGKTDIQRSLTNLFTKGHYFDYLIEYNIKRPSLGTYAINTTYKLPLNNVVSQEDIEGVIQNSISIGLVPANTKLTDRNLYFVLPPSGFSTSSSHFYYPYPRDDTNPKFPFAWVNYATDIDTLTVDITKQLVNAITNPVPDTGIVSLNINSTNGGYELTDACSTVVPSSVMLPAPVSVKVAKYFSNAIGECWAPSTNVPFITCSSKSLIWDNASQTCRLGPGPLLPASGPGQLPPITPSTNNSAGIVGAGGALKGVQYQVGYRVQTFTASSSYDIDVPNNAGDGYYGTKWSAFGVGQWLKADLGTAQNVSIIKIAWYRGESRTNDFQVHTSTDDSTYTLVLTASSSGATSGLESYIFGPVSAQYVAITCLGNSENKWGTITEVQVWGPDVPIDPGVVGGTGSGSGEGGPPSDASYNFIDTSFSVDFQDLDLCNPLTGGG